MTDGPTQEKKGQEESPDSDVIETINVAPGTDGVDTHVGAMPLDK